MRLPFALVFAIVLINISRAQIPACPSQPGVYGLKDDSWVDLPIAKIKKVKDRTDSVFLAHSHITDVFWGQSSLLVLGANTLFCVSNPPLGATFPFARARVKKDSREVGVGKWVPWSGSFYFEIDKDQQIPIEQKRDANGALTFKSPPISPGQYILLLQQGTSVRSAPTAFQFGIQ